MERDCRSGWEVLRLIRDWGAADPGVWAATVGDCHAEHYLIGTRRVGDHHGHGVEMIEGPSLVLMAERQIDRRADGRYLRVRWN